jgi:hypothetical protein
VVLAGEDERPHHALAVDVERDLVGVLLDDREQVGQQLALDRRQVGGQIRERPVRVVRAVDRPVTGDGDRRVRVDRAVGRSRPARDRRPPQLSRGGQAALRIVSVVRNRSPSSRRAW